MKKVGSLLIVVLVLAVSASAVFAGPSSLPGGGWWSPFQIQNVGDGTATVTYTAHWVVGGSGGDTTYSQDGDITVDSGGSVTYNPALAPNYPTGSRIGFDTTDGHLPTGFAGGVEIASTEPLRAVVTVNNFEAGGGVVGTPGGRASAYYQSVQEPGTTINFPVMKHNYYGQTTNFYIQAAGGDATINATYTYGGSSSTVTGVAIADGKSYLLDPASATPPVPATGNGTLGSLVVTAVSGEIAGVIIEAQHNVDPGTFALSTKGFGPDDADTTIVAPTNKTIYYGGSTGWQLLNTTSTEATAVVTFTVSGVGAGSLAATAGIAVGDQFAANVTIPASGSYLFSVGNGNYYKATDITGTTSLTEGLFFSGLAVSTQPLVATVNEANGPNRILYSAFGAGNATTKLAAPAVKEAFYSQRTSLVVQNVGTASTTPSVSYACSDGSTYDFDSYKAIAPGEAVNFFMLSDAGHSANGWNAIKVPVNNNCAVSVTATQPIVAVAQESISTGTQDLKNYEGFNLVP